MLVAIQRIVFVIVGGLHAQGNTPWRHVTEMQGTPIAHAAVGMGRGG